MEEQTPQLFETTVSQEVAELEFKRFADYLRVKHDTSKMNGEDRDSFDQIRNRIVDEIVDGNATVDQDGKLTYSLQFPGGEVTSLTFSRPKAWAYTEMDKFKDRQAMNKIFGFASAMVGQSPKFLTALDGVDGKFILSITNLFLGS